jgi:hypothetical protein
MTPLQFLDTLRHAIAIEEPMLRFDYFTFHLRCLAVLRSLRDVVDDKLKQYFGNDYIEDDTQLPYVICYIFEVARNTAAIGENTKLRNVLGSSLMIKAAQVVREFIEREGHMESDKLSKLCVHWSREADFTEGTVELSEVVKVIS